MGDRITELRESESGTTRLGTAAWHGVERAMGALMFTVLVGSSAVVPAYAGVTAGKFVGPGPCGVLAVLAAGAVAASWCSRVVLAARWVRTGELAWHRTTFIPALLRAGRDRGQA
jgi:hypothetical protein